MWRSDALNHDDDDDDNIDDDDDDYSLQHRVQSYNTPNVNISPTERTETPSAFS